MRISGPCIRAFLTSLKKVAFLKICYVSSTVQEFASPILLLHHYFLLYNLTLQHLIMGNQVGVLYCAEKACALNPKNEAVLELMDDLNTSIHP